MSGMLGKESIRDRKMTDDKESDWDWRKYHPGRKIEETPMWLVCLFGYIDGIRSWLSGGDGLEEPK